MGLWDTIKRWVSGSGSAGRQEATDTTAEPSPTPPAPQASPAEPAPTESAPVGDTEAPPAHQPPSGWTRDDDPRTD